MRIVIAMRENCIMLNTLLNIYLRMRFGDTINKFIRAAFGVISVITHFV